MKKSFLLVKLIIFVFMIFMPLTVRAKTVSLNELYEIRNNEEQIEEVTEVHINGNDNLKYVNILPNVPNLTYIYIVGVSFDDFTFINNINHEFSISYNGGYDCYINLMGINNQYLNTLYLSLSTVTNLSEISHLKNLKRLSMEYINYNDIDYTSLSELTNLESLSLIGIGIGDYQQFFNSVNRLNKLEALALEGTNIQNKDIKNLKTNDNIKGLYLQDTMITDISFLNEMSNVENISLPSYVKDFSVLYELENLKGVFWDDFTEYNVTSDLVKYLDSNGISHTKYFAELRNIIDKLVDDTNILETDSDYIKVLKVMKVIQSFANINSDYIPGSDSTLSKIVLYKQGVCANWSALVNTMLNIVGVESYKIGGRLGGAHAWNIIKIDGKLYAIDVMNARPIPSDYFDISTWSSSTKAAMFRDLFKVNSYGEIYARNNNLDYNYEYPLIYIETDGYDKTRMLYEFEVVDGIENISQKNIWVDLNTNIDSIDFVPISGYSYKYYDSLGNVKNNGIAKMGDYIIVTSSSNKNYFHKYEIIVEEKTYEIKLETDSFGRNESIIVKNGEKYTGLFTPVKFCYKFLGWYTAKVGGTLITQDSIVDISKVDTLYAHWEFDNKYILTTHLGEGYSSSTYVFEENGIYHDAKNTFSYSAPDLFDANFAAGLGEKFSGYYTEKEGGILLTDYSIVVTNASHDAYAHFVDEDEILYMVKVNCLGCDDNTLYSSWLIEPNAKIAKFYNPTREGYIFKEWQLNGSKYDFNTPVTSDITLTAVWVENKNTLFDLLKNNGYNLNNNFVFNFAFGDSIENIKKKLGDDIIIDSVLSIISTGTVIKKDNESYTAVIEGDVNGDGKMNVSDIVKINNHIVDETKRLEGAYSLAGDYNGDNKLNIQDIVKINNAIVGGN